MKLTKIIFTVILIISIVGVLITLIYEVCNAKKQEQIVANILDNVIPKEFLGVVETSENPAYEINSISYIGIISIPKLDIKYPVLKEENEKKKFTFSMYSLEEANKIVIIANNDYGRIDILKMLREYDSISFKNMRGFEKQYIITSVTTENEQVNNFDEDIIIKIKDYDSYLTIKGIIKQ